MSLSDSKAAMTDEDRAWAMETLQELQRLLQLIKKKIEQAEAEADAMMGILEDE